jgi:hypothetical protein
MPERGKRVRKGILKQWPPPCPTGGCDENKGCVCNKRRSSAAADYYDTVKIIYSDCKDIPSQRPGSSPSGETSDAADATSDASDATDQTHELDLTCHETLEDTPPRKRVRWEAVSPPRRSGLQKRWESARVVLCIVEDVDLMVHDGSLVTREVPPVGSCYA